MQKTTVYRSHEVNLKLKKIVYYILGIIQSLLLIRLIFRLLGANPESPFVSFIYSISGIFLAPFTGIFRAAATNGIETTAILEPSIIIAIIVYTLIAYGVVRLIEIYQTPKGNV